MILKLRPYGGNFAEVAIEISKTLLVSDLIAEASNAFQTKPNSLELFFCGKVLLIDHPLLYYKLKDNDVIGVRIKVGDVIPCHSSLVKDSKFCEEIEDKLCTSKYFKAGDKIYYQSPQNGQWHEATVLSVIGEDNENSSPNSESKDSVTYNIHDGTTNKDLVMQLNRLRPCSAVEYTAHDLKVGMKILAYVVLSDSQRGWYQVEITKVEPGRNQFPKVFGTVVVSAETTYPRQKIDFKYRTVQFPELLPREEWINLISDKSLTIPCKHCFNHPTQKCMECSCVICGGKHDEDKQLICDECEDAYHMECASPPVSEIPENEWFCHNCSHVDQDLQKKYEVQTEVKVKKIKECVDKVKQNKRDWGKGLSTAAVSDKFCVVPKEHLGKIPGVPSGRLWPSRHDVSRFGVHRPLVAGICGATDMGAQSVCFSGGYEGDYDKGNIFVMSGSGGRDLGTNKRISKQSHAQILTGPNLALAQSCYSKVDHVNGAKSTNWRKGLPIRVVRGYKLAKISNYAPPEGYRYDGIYKVVRYFQKEVNGNLMWKFELRRDDPEPPPWTSSGLAFMITMSVGAMEGTRLIENIKKRKLAYECVDVKRTKIAYVMPPAVATLIKEDTLNQRNWMALQTSLDLGYPEFIRAVAEQFVCVICQEVAKDPFTMKCGHNSCIKCMGKWLKSSARAYCPFCQADVDSKSVKVNKPLDKALNALLPGYNPKQPPPKPFSLVRKSD
ncbi:E3 ubiquitin-protein ligase UHRF1-like [Cloeon dipterum]|uniref:E3 ubiquitin-protein ligase UHRF1-like n=1 Tax=Cloeon dipterum TaxID=197152 RepID=UPI0032207980